MRQHLVTLTAVTLPAAFSRTRTLDVVVRRQ